MALIVHEVVVVMSLQHDKCSLFTGAIVIMIMIHDADDTSDRICVGLASTCLGFRVAGYRVVHFNSKGSFVWSLPGSNSQDVGFDGFTKP